MGRVLFYHPIRQSEYPLCPPIDVISLAGVLAQHGYNVSILDEKMLNGKPQLQDLGNLDDIIYIWISVRASRQATRGLEFAKWVRNVAPAIPLIWGGWAPTRLPSIFAGSPYVDCAVVGDAEKQIVSLTEAIYNHSGFHHVPSIAYRGNDGEVVVNERDTITDFVDTIPMAYHLVDLPSYLARNGRTILYRSSKGCNGVCSFCEVADTYPHHYSALSPSRVLEEVDHLVRKYGVKSVVFDDTNFFLNRERSLSIAEGFLERDLNLQWGGYGRVDQLSDFTDKEISLLERSGCQWVSVGFESGSQRVLDSMKKNLTVEVTQSLVSKLASTEIKILGHFIFGFPGETREDLEQTIDLVLWIKRQNRRNDIWLHTLIPVFHLPLKYKRQGAFFNENGDLESILNKMEHPNNRMGWLDRKAERDVKSTVHLYLRAYLKFLNTQGEEVAKKEGLFKRTLNSVIRHSATRRMDNKVFGFPVLWWAKKIQYALMPSSWK